MWVFSVAVPFVKTYICIRQILRNLEHISQKDLEEYQSKSQNMTVLCKSVSASKFQRFYSVLLVNRDLIIVEHKSAIKVML